MPPEQIPANTPPYWIPFLVAWGMGLTFLYFLGAAFIKEFAKPIMHTMDMVNETMISLRDNSGEAMNSLTASVNRLNEKMAILLDRNGIERP